MNRTSGCLTKRGDILLVATKEGDYLFIDTIENRVLTRIPEKQPVNCLLINESMTGVYTYSLHHTLHFYQFNNCITPILSLVRIIWSKSSCRRNNQRKVQK